jgi:hypothetical protein
MGPVLWNGLRPIGLSGRVLILVARMALKGPDAKSRRLPGGFVAKLKNVA